MAGARPRAGARRGLGRRRRRARRSPTTTPTSPGRSFATARARPALPALARRRLAGADRARRPLRAPRLARRRRAHAARRRAADRGGAAASTATMRSRPRAAVVVARRRCCSTAASPGASPAAACSPAATSRTTSCWRRACGATTTSRSRTTTPAATRSSTTACRSSRTISSAAATARSTRSTPSAWRIVAAPIYAAGGYYGVVAFLVCCAAGAAAGLVARGAAAHGLGARGDARVGRRRRQRAVRLQQHHRLSRDPGRGVRDGRLPDRHAARRPRPAPRARRGRAARVLALLPWLSSKYALMMAALAALALGRLWLPDDRRRRDGATRGHVRAAPVVPFAQRIRVSLALGLPMVVSVALWMAFFYWIWGSPFPSVVYGTQRPGPLGVPRQGRPRPALRPGIRHRAGGADLRGVAGRAGRDARGRTHARAASPRRSP